MKLTRNQKIAFWTILLLQLCLLLFFVFCRLIDYDEPSYISAGLMVANGKLPYVDFFYAQMPYLSFLFAPVSGYGFNSLFWCRLISALAALILGVVLFRAAHEFFGDPRASLAAFFLYGLSGLLLTWHSTAKTLVVADLFGFISFFFLVRFLVSEDNRRSAWILLSGLCMGLALNFRLTFSVVWLISIALIFFLSDKRSLKQKLAAFLLFGLGTAVSSSLGIYLLLKDPWAFAFDNLTYHQILGLDYIRMSFVSRLFTVCKFVLYPQNLFIVIAAAVGLAAAVRKNEGFSGLVRKHKATFSALAFAGGLTIVSFCISPTTFQHYEQVLPYLLISSVPGLGMLIAKWSKTARWAGTGLYALLIIPFVLIFIFAIRDRDKPYPISEVQKVVRMVKQNSEPGQMILSTWPAYAVFAQREPAPGLETWGWEVVPLLSERQLQGAKLISRKGTEELILEKKPAMVVDWEWFCSLYAEALEPNYRLLGSVGPTLIYRLK
jgi:4-amino-4-deoxy-L-arabinose transferase-like glycosyltransferase